MFDLTKYGSRLALGGVLLAMVAPVLAQSPEADVRQAQAARFAATIKGDQGALSALISDGLLYGHSSGKLETKAEFLDLIKTGFYQYKSIAPHEVTARVHGDSAVLSGLADIEVVNGGKPLSLKLRFLETWVKEGGKWKLAAWQSTRLPPPTP